MDVFSDVLDILRIPSASLFRATLRAPWAFAVGAQEEIAPCYIVSSGSCTIEIEGSPAPVRLSQRDLVLLPYGNAHILRAEPGDKLVPLEELLGPSTGADEPREIVYGGSGGETVIIVGRFHIEHTQAQLLFPASEPLVHIHANEAAVETWLDTLADLICKEARAHHPGNALAVSRLMDLLFLQLVRTGIMTDAGGENGSGSFLRALADPHLASALEQIHQHSEYPWTVAALAAHVGMSRTAFAIRFARVAGVPPLTYLRRWRALKASDLLYRGDATLAEIALRVGYDSEAAFAKAFKREMGVSPGAYRQQQRHRENRR